MQPHNFFSTDATPSHSSRKNLILNSKKSPASTQEVSESEVPVHAESEVPRSEQHTAALQSLAYIVCRLLLGNHTAEAASALRSRKTQRAAKEKSTPISQFFFSTCCACIPTRPPCPGEAPHPPPLPENSAKCTALQ